MPHTGVRYNAAVIRAFGDSRTEELFLNRVVPAFSGFARAAKRKLESLNAATTLADLLVPPSNRLEKLRGELQGLYSIRVNDQWRIVFRWDAGDAFDVRIVDYH